MASITVTKLTANVGAGTFTTDMSTLAGATEHEVTGINKSKNVVFYGDNTSAAQRAITIKAGDFAANRGVGDITFNLPSNIPSAIAVEGSRIVNKDGSIEFTVATGMTGDLSVFELPT
jgi:hypothetical protein